MRQKSEGRIFRVAPNFYEVWEKRLKPHGVGQQEMARKLGDVLRALPAADMNRLYRLPKRGASILTPAGWGRQGQLEAVAFPIILFVAALLIVVFIMASNSLKDMISDATDAGVFKSEEGERMENTLNSLPTTLNVVFVGGAVALGIALIWLSALIPTHPMLVIIVLPALFLGTYFSVQIGNGWDSYTSGTDGAARTAIDNLGAVNHILSHLVEYFLGVSLVAGLAFYAALRRPGASLTGGGVGGGFA